MKTLKLLTLLLLVAAPVASVEAGNSSHSKVTVDLSLDNTNNNINAVIKNKQNKAVTVKLTISDNEGKLVGSRTFELEPLQSVNYYYYFDLDASKSYTTDVKVMGSETKPQINGTTLINGFLYITGNYNRF